MATQRLACQTFTWEMLGDSWTGGPDDLVDAIGLPKEKLCTYCWDGCEGCAKKAESKE